MKTLFVFLAVFLLDLPARAQEMTLEEKVERCQEVLERIEFLEQNQPEPITPGQARLAVHELVRDCGYMNNFLHAEIIQAHAGGRISNQKLEEYWEFSRIGWEMGLWYYESLGRSRHVRRCHFGDAF
jgi:hypothetical protein